jgi:hypothetical protein
LKGIIFYLQFECHVAQYISLFPISFCPSP